MQHYDYLDSRPRQAKVRKTTLWIGFALVFFSLQGIVDLTLKIPFLIVGNLIILLISYLELNKELMILTVLMGIAQLTRLL
jgi:hypothetical protein